MRTSRSRGQPPNHPTAFLVRAGEKPAQPTPFHPPSQVGPDTPSTQSRLESADEVQAIGVRGWSLRGFVCARSVSFSPAKPNLLNSCKPIGRLVSLLARS